MKFPWRVGLVLVSLAVFLPCTNLKAKEEVQEVPVGYTLTLTTQDDGSGIVRVKYYINNRLMKTITKSPATFAWKVTRKGTYKIKVVSEDKAGNKSTEVATLVAK